MTRAKIKGFCACATLDKLISGAKVRALTVAEALIARL